MAATESRTPTVCPDAASLAPRVAALAGTRTHQRLKATLHDDMVTEYDARFLTDWVGALDVPLGDAFREVFATWSVEEDAHYRAFRRVRVLFGGEVDSELAGRRPDFSGIAHLFRDEFEILCLLAYDELATIRGYKGNLDLYACLGAEFAGFIRQIVADEAAHYAAFRGVLRSEHAARLAEAPEVIRRIRAADGMPYQATFVLDHDDPVYGAHIFDDAARVLEHQLTR